MSYREVSQIIENSTARDRPLEPVPEPRTIARKPVARSQAALQKGDYQIQSSEDKLNEKGSDHLHPPSTPIHKSTTPWYETWWGFELAAICISFAAFASLVAVLATSNNHVQRTFLWQGLTLNGLVAILSTLTRASLLFAVAAAIDQSKWITFSQNQSGTSKSRPLEDLEYFDQASRGAWGSAKLLLYNRGGWLVSLGALLVIQSLAFDTFAQQVVTTRSRNVAAEGSITDATFPRSASYSENDLDYSGINGGPTVSKVYYKIPLSMRAAIYTGTFASNVPDLPVHCSTGNCTWPIVPSLGICGACTNVTGNLTASCKGGNNEEYEGATYCNYTLPSGTYSSTSSVSEGMSTSDDVFTSNMTTGEVYSCNTPTAQRSTSMSGCLPDRPLYIANFEVISTPYLSNSGSLAAIECALWFCVESYNISVASNEPHQRVLSTTSKHTPATSSGYRFLEILTDVNRTPNISVSSDAYTTMFSAIDLSAKATYTSVSNGMSGEESTTFSSDVAQALWSASSDWDTWIARFAKSLSNEIRSTPTAANDTRNIHYAGVAHTEKTYVSVRWGWLAFPAGMVLASLIFVLLTMWQSHKRNLYAWKGSSLIFLFTSFIGSVDENVVKGLHEPGGLARRVGKDKVVLGRDERGFLAFVKTE